MYLALKGVRGLVVLAGQQEAFIDEDLIQLAVPKQAQEVLCLVIAPLTGHKCQVVELVPVSPAPPPSLGIGLLMNGQRYDIHT